MAEGGTHGEADGSEQESSVSPSTVAWSFAHSECIREEELIDEPPFKVELTVKRTGEGSLQQRMNTLRPCCILSGVWHFFSFIHLLYLHSILFQGFQQEYYRILDMSHDPFMVSTIVEDYESRMEAARSGRVMTGVSTNVV